MRIEIFRIANQIVRPLRRQQVGLHDEIKERICFPFGVAEPLVARRGRDRRGGFFAGHAAHRRAPQFEISLAELHLQLGRPGLIGQPVLRHGAQGLDHFRNLARWAVVGIDVLSRLEIGCERPAAIFHRSSQIERKGLGVELCWRLCFGGDVAHDSHFKLVSEARRVVSSGQRMMAQFN